MATGNLLALLDDIASMLDDISAMTKVTAGKTTGLLGDDLALNAHQLTGVRAERELPVVWAVAKGSFLNKCILLPLAFLISAFIPWLIQPLLMLGGLYLCFEGSEKVLHLLFHHQNDEQAKSHRQVHRQKLEESAEALLAFEKDKIRGAIRTDFILSAEIIVIALGTVQSMELMGSIIVVSIIAILMTVGVYSLVAAIVKLDDMGLLLMTQHKSPLAVKLGRAVLQFCPWFMKGLSVVGTLAMFLVGGAILVHGLPPVAHMFELALAPVNIGWVHSVGMILIEAFCGFLIGALAVGVMGLGQRLLVKGG